MKKRRGYRALLVTTAATAAMMVAGGEWARAQGQPAAVMGFTVAPDGQGAFTYPATTVFETRITTGRPYTAEATTEFTQVLGDGNKISRKATVRIYRDSDGRTRREDLAADGTVRSISIYDPVSHVTYVLDPATRTARKSAVRVVLPQRVVSDEIKGKLEERIAVERAAGGSAGGRVALVAPGQVTLELPPEGGLRKRTAEIVVGGAAVGGVLQPSMKGIQDSKEETLGQKVIEGVVADGKRVTTTLPAGAIGNEEPITVLSEQWFSSDLELLVMTRHSDPRSGETTYTLSNIVRAEPAGGLFDVPQDYTIVGSGYMRSPAER